MVKLEDLEFFLNIVEDVPTFEKMPRNTLKDKGINGPTSAHKIEEVHTPFNYELLTFSTGTSAFQNIVGVVSEEIPNKIKATKKALELSNVKKGDKILVTYPPLVNVFSKEGLEEYGLDWFFLMKSSRDALIFHICKDRPDVIIGESSFLRATIEDAKKTGFFELFPKKMILITAGTTLDLELLEIIKDLPNYEVHDLYGAQEFGWITLDGIPVREDITLIPTEKDSFFDLIVGGISSGDRFFVGGDGHILNSSGKIVTYTKERVKLEHETIILETTLGSEDSAFKVAKTILRSKGKIVRVHEDVKIGQSENKLGLKYYNSEELFILEGRLDYFETICEALLNYQSQNKKDLTWTKRS